MADRGAGQLREKCAWDAREDVDDGYGNTVSIFVEQFTSRADFTYLRGGEAVIAGRLTGKQPVVVRVRRNKKTRRINETWRMRDTNNGSWDGDSGFEQWTGPLYAVRSVIVTEDRYFLDIMIQSGEAA